MIGIEFCGNCRFFADNDCRRYPPQAGICATDNQHPVFYNTVFWYPQITEMTPCCGEFRAAEQ